MSLDDTADTGEGVPDTVSATMSRDAPTETPLTRHLNTTFDVLRASRRRYVLYYLADTDHSVVERDTVVEAVAELEHELTGEQPDDTYTHITTELHHVHLPHLERAGIIEYDTRQGTIRVEDTADIAEWIDLAKRLELN